MDENHPEEVLLDENVEAAKHSFFMTGGASFACGIPCVTLVRRYEEGNLHMYPAAPWAYVGADVAAYGG